MTTFKTIPALRMLALAVKAGHKNDQDFAGFSGNNTQIFRSVQHEYILFALGICEALSHVNYDSMMLGMDQIAKIAKEQANFEEYNILDPKHGGNIDTAKMIASSQRSVFFERFAHLIGKEIKEAIEMESFKPTHKVIAAAPGAIAFTVGVELQELGDNFYKSQHGQRTRVDVKYLEKI